MSTPKFVAYLRVSTDRQGRSGLGLEAQREAIRSHVEAVNGKILTEFVEIESGTDDERVEVHKALDLARRARASIIVAKLDRVGRSVWLVASVLKSGTTLVDATNPNASPMELHLRSLIAEEEARAISARTSAALQVAKARGAKLGSARPGHWKGRENLRLAGLAKARARLAIVQGRLGEAARVEAMPVAMELQAQGFSMRAIAENLNAQGILSTRGATWSASTVIRMLNRQ
jgi:DNA invertase Pin-like site-specific DNA recombinase